MRFLFICFILFIHEMVFAQHTYNEQATKPIGNNIREIKITRYNFEKSKKNEFPRDTVIIDTIRNESGFIDSIITKGISYEHREFEYPDTALYQRKVFNKKGLLIFEEYPFDVRVDWPSYKADSLWYDTQNRLVEQKVYEKNSVLPSHINKNTYIDSLKIIRIESDDYDVNQTFGKDNRLIEGTIWYNKELYGITKYQYSANEKEIKALIYDAKLKLDRFTIYKYDLYHRKLEELDFYSNSHFASGNYYTYDKNGNLTQDKWLVDKKEIREIINYTYNEKNNLQSEKRKDEKNEIYFSIKYFYTKDNLIDYREEYDKNNLLIARYKYEYKFWLK